MQLKLSEQAAVIYLSGVIHRESADSVTALFNHALETKTPVIVISFHHVKALLSDGIRLMIALCDRARSANKEFYITDLSKEVKYTLQITNLLTLLGNAGNTLNLLQQKQINEAGLREIAVKLPTEANPAVEQPAPVAAPVAPVAPAAPAPAPVQSTAENLQSLKSIGNLNRPAAPASPTPTPAPAAKTGVSERMRAATTRVRRLSDAELWTTIKSHVPGRIELKVVEVMTHSKKDVINITDIVAGVREDREKVKNAMKRLMNRGTITAVGGGLFNYSPNEDLKEMITSLLRMQLERDMHTKILKLLLDAERHN